MTKSKNNINQFLFVFLALLCLISPFFGVITATNAEDIYSNVLTDLQKDETFNVADYPVVEDDYSLQVIQIAESTDSELLVYVYQPTGQKEQLKATTIRLSTSIGSNLSPHDYDLEFLNSNNTLFKYKIKDFQVLADVVRYYEVIAIHRKYIEGVDEPPTGEGQVINEVEFDVGTRWTACTLDGKVTYEKLNIETIEITDKRAGSVRYVDGIPTYFEKSCDSHFVAFSTDFPIDDLKEAKVSFYVQERTNTGYKGELEFKEKELTEYDSAVMGSGIFNAKHERQRISSVADFIKTEKLKDDIKQEISSMQWVLRFYETEYKSIDIRPPAIITYFEVTEVTVLRLKFETAGKVYNLGVVDNKQTGPNVPDSKPFDLLEWLKTHIVEFLMILLGIIVCVPLFIAFFPQIIAFIGKLVVLIAKGIWYILTLPWQILKNE